MPTTLTHAFVPIALGGTIIGQKMPVRFWVLLALCAISPDIDVFTALFGVEHGDFLGHRGFFHSLTFAFLLSLVVVLLAFRKTSVFSKKWWLILLFFFIATASHNIFDMLTDSGLGIALFSPFDTRRYLFPWRPLSPSPIGIRGTVMFLSGKAVVIGETVWVWLPFTAMLVAAKVYRRIKKGVNPALGIGGE